MSLQTVLALPAAHEALPPRCRGVLGIGLLAWSAAGSIAFERRIVGAYVRACGDSIPRTLAIAASFMLIVGAAVASVAWAYDQIGGDNSSIAARLALYLPLALGLGPIVLVLSPAQTHWDLPTLMRDAGAPEHIVQAAYTMWLPSFLSMCMLVAGFVVFFAVT